MTGADILYRAAMRRKVGRSGTRENNLDSTPQPRTVVEQYWFTEGGHEFRRDGMLLRDVTYKKGEMQ